MYGQMIDKRSLRHSKGVESGELLSIEGEYWEDSDSALDDVDFFGTDRTEKAGDDEVFERAEGGEGGEFIDDRGSRLNFLPEQEFNREFNIESWFAAPELKRAKDKKALEVSVWWGSFLLDIGHFTRAQRISFGPSPIAHFRYQLYPSVSGAVTPIVEAAPNGDFLLCFDPDLFGYIEENGEKVTLVELIQRGRAHTFASSDYYYYPIRRGTKVFIQAEGLEIQIQFVDISLISPRWFRYIDSSASILSLSILLHIVLTLVAIYYTLSP